jgi:hypothetical protein
MSEERCELCRFYEGQYHASEDTASGFCRRYPPTWRPRQITVQRHEHYAEFPLVAGAAWCGEFAHEPTLARGAQIADSDEGHPV